MADGYGSIIVSGERKIYHLGYLADAEQLENMSLNFYGSGKNHSVLKCFE